jgi:D-galactarolactone cycloisomerase
MMPRRNFLTGIPSLAAASTVACGYAKQAGRLKITDIRQIPLRVIRDAGYLEPAWSPGVRGLHRIGGGEFIEIHTDQGLVGIGPHLPPEQLEPIKRQLIGTDPFDTEQHEARLRSSIAGQSTRGSSSIDIALWDLVGKACGQPLYKIWGCAKERVCAYASLIEVGTPAARARLAIQLRDEGWKAIKVRLHNATLKEDIALVEAVRKAVGDRMEIMADANQTGSPGDWQPGIQWDFYRALETARELKNLNCAWLEEPLPRYHFDQLAELHHRIEMPLAGGESNRGIHEFLTMLRQDIFDIIQPEVMLAEGATVLRKIASLAEAFGRQIVPHNGGGNLGTIAHLHLIASWRNAPYIELLHDPPIGDYRHGFVMMQNPPFVDREGFMPLPEGPGLGVEINRDLLAYNRARDSILGQ